jgi:hypothetical protein
VADNVNYLEVTKTYWSVFLRASPPFFRKRLEYLMKSGYLTPAGGDKYRSLYRITGGRDEYERGSSMLMDAAI